MFKTGMTTVTFRNFGCEENIDLVRRAGLDGIEWADKYHVLSGDVGTAGRIGELTRSAGLEVLSYGSFYNPSKQSRDDFRNILDCALALKTEVIRIWPGNCGSVPADSSYRKAVSDEIRAACHMAGEYGITVAMEYHPNTLTDTPESALQLIDEVGCGNLKTYWQPNALTQEKNLAELRAVLPHVLNVHVSYSIEHEICSLSEGGQQWGVYLELLRTAPGDHSLIIEFVKDSAPCNFFSDARTLCDWIQRRNYYE